MPHETHRKQQHASRLPKILAALTLQVGEVARESKTQVAASRVALKDNVLRRGHQRAMAGDKARLTLASNPMSSKYCQAATASSRHAGNAVSAAKLLR